MLVTAYNKTLCTIRVEINDAFAYILAWCWDNLKVPKGLTL